MLTFREHWVKTTTYYWIMGRPSRWRMPEVFSLLMDQLSGKFILYPEFWNSCRISGFYYFYYYHLLNNTPFLNILNIFLISYDSFPRAISRNDPCRLSLSMLAETETSRCLFCVLFLCAFFLGWYCMNISRRLYTYRKKHTKTQHTPRSFSLCKH